MAEMEHTLIGCVQEVLHVPGKIGWSQACVYPEPERFYIDLNLAITLYFI